MTLTTAKAAPPSAPPRGLAPWVPVAGVVVLALIALPFVAPLIGISNYILSFFFLLFLNVAMASSWNLFCGYSGYVSFGHAGFFGVGAYVAAVLIATYLQEWPVAVLAGGVATGALALLIGLPVLRLRGPYFTIALLGLTEVARIVVSVWEPVTKGGRGIFLPPKLDITPDYLAMLATAVVVIALTYWLATSKHGPRLIAIREDEIAAEVVGVPTTRYKLIVFAVAAIFPGLAGGLYAYNTNFIDPGSVFNMRFTVYAIAMTMFGGSGTILGPVLGAVLLTVVSEALWTSYPFLHTAIFGALIVGVLLFMPGGVLALARQRGLLPRSRRY